MQIGRLLHVQAHTALAHYQMATRQLRHLLSHQMLLADPQTLKEFRDTMLTAQRHKILETEHRQPPPTTVIDLNALLARRAEDAKTFGVSMERREDEDPMDFERRENFAAFWEKYLSPSRR